MRPLLGALENESISMTILGKASPKLKSHLPEKEGGIRFFNGAKRIRTADPLHAMQVLYQLSYGPIGALGGPNPGDSVGLEGPDSALVELTPQRVQALRAGARRPQACPGR